MWSSDVKLKLFNCSLPIDCILEAAISKILPIVISFKVVSVLSRLLCRCEARNF
jgi:hypothetical protein